MLNYFYKFQKIDLEIFNELKNEYEDMKEMLELCRHEKEIIEKDFEELKERLKIEITDNVEEKNERIACLQKGMCL